MNPPKYLIGLCELYHPHYHRCLNNIIQPHNQHFIYSSYILLNEINIDSFFNNHHFFNDDNSRAWLQIVQHPFIRNYFSLMDKYNIDIIEKINITPDKEICLIKTCWLKIFQRVCKKKIQKKLLIYQKRKHPKSIMFRQIHGKWKE